MRDVLSEIARFRAEELRVCLARVVQVEGSGPRDPGATMVVAEDGQVAGSVSGGCVEGAVVEACLECLDTGEARLVRFGYSDDEAFAVGLTCGGVITIFCSPEVPDVFDDFVAATSSAQPVALATVVALEDSGASLALDGRRQANACIVDERDLFELTHLGATVLVRQEGNLEGSLGSAVLDEVVSRDGAGVVSSGRSVIRHYGKKGETVGTEISVFYESFTPPPKMVIFGAVDFTAALVRVAKVLGYDVTVCDARAPFATQVRFPEADEVIVDWPHRYLDRVNYAFGPRDAICVLTHDPKFDVPAIVAALRTEVGYLGAMGSRKTHAERAERLREAGVNDEQLERIMSPIGLDLGSRTPEETAISICAEIIAHQTGHAGASLKRGTGPIHRVAADQRVAV